MQVYRSQKLTRHATPTGFTALRQNKRKPCQPSQAVLSKSQYEQFHSKGFLVVDDFADPESVKALMASSDEMLKSFQPDEAVVYSTKQNKPLGEEYWLESANNISYFLEEGAHGEDGKLSRNQDISVNKIGHAMHDLDPAFRAYSRGPKVQELLADLGYRNPLPVQSMVFCKNSHTGAQVVPHQDSSYLYTDPPSVVGLWLALQDATIENGCLYCLPGSHHDGVARRLVNRPEEGGVQYIGDMEWDARDWEARHPEFEPVEVKAGSLLLLHGSNIHFSKDNTSPNPRRAYALHIVEGADGYHWQKDNWVARHSDFPFEPLYGSAATMP